MRKFPSDIPYVFDNDCLASFLWVNRIDLLHNLFPGQIKVPETVFDELSFLKQTRSAWVFNNFLRDVNANVIEKLILPSTGPIAEEYIRLINAKVKIGRGEAAALSYVRFAGGTVASNNLKDVARYCRDHGLNLISTDDILCYACIRGLISETQGNNLWERMKLKGRTLPKYSFFEALRRFKQDQPK